MSYIYRSGGLRLRLGYCLAVPVVDCVFDIDGEAFDSKSVITEVLEVDSVTIDEREFSTDGLTTSL